mgnify:CR=1 FL=1
MASRGPAQPATLGAAARASTESLAPTLGDCPGVSELMVGQVKAMLLSDWELGCTWYHGVGTATASAPDYFDQAEPG